MDTEQQTQELNLEGGGTLPLENIAASEANIAEKTPETTPEPAPTPESEIKGEKDTSHAFFWTGTDIMGVLYHGSADTSADCYAGAAALCAATCNIVSNPDYVAPIPEVVLTPDAIAYNEAYSQGYQDAYAKYEDMKQMVQHFAQNEAVAGNDVEKFDFVVYVRNNP